MSYVSNLRPEGLVDGFFENLAVKVDPKYARTKYFEMLRKLGFSFERLLDEVLPGLVSKIRSLESICKIFAGSLEDFKIVLPDGTLVFYRCVKYSHPTIRYGSKDPMTGEVIRHRIMFNEPKCIDKEAFVRSDPESGACIGCVDSSRDFVRFGRKGITFNHVHDAFYFIVGM